MNLAVSDDVTNLIMNSLFFRGEEGCVERRNVLFAEVVS